ncbi:50S ribosomal protein L15 [Carex littledalei]|uniref:50S ribosomal protein L15 n=1 Tax=Carex littledalei TaxID=544730 RepID=A0A833VRP3_9POAL|nr:50S ribosomal protein L15 [Carex littledalei]
MASLLSLSLSSTPTQVKSVRHLLSASFTGNAVAISRSIQPLRNSCKTQSLIVHAWVKRDPAGARVRDDSERLRLDNLRPQVGSRKKPKRKGRGTAAGQGNSCGFGMRGQKSRSGPGVRKGFEGGQMPLYRRLPKLRGIAGGMKVGLPKYVAVNLKDIADLGFRDGDEVCLETLKAIGLINPSGRERRLPLKILGDGELKVKLHFKARAFSSSAKEKLEAAGCTLTELPGRKKWLKPSVVKNIARAEKYFAAKKASVTKEVEDSA